MKKITLITATLFAAAAIAGTSLTANAANVQNHNILSGNCKIIRMNRTCDITSLFSQLQDCLPGIQFPQPEQPDIENTPQLPDNNTPETPEKPEIPQIPEIPEKPEQPEESLSYARQIVRLVNQERAKEGLAPLTLDAGVSTAAQVRAVEIVTSFSHTRPDGSSFATALKEQNINYRRAGENIAWGQRSPEEVVNAWMNSAGHRANIMNPDFTTIGVGHHLQNGVNYWCQLFTA